MTMSRARVVSYGWTEDGIAKISEHILRAVPSGHDFRRIACVFGGKRPGLFLKKQLAQTCKDGFFPPRIFSMDEFMEYIVQKQEGVFGRLCEWDGCFALYGIAQKLCPDILSRHKGFAEFFPWAREWMRLCDELDQESVSADTLRQWQEHAALGSDVPIVVGRLLCHWNAIREAWCVFMQEHKLFSQGYIYASAARLITQTAFDEFDTIVFGNLFYLSKTEEQVLSYLSENHDNTVFFFQGSQDQWPLLGAVAQKLKCPIRPAEIESGSPRISCYAAGDLHAQIGAVRQILNTIVDKEHTVIVLPDPDAIVPLISEIAGSIDACNISMGYPLHRSPLGGLFTALFNAQRTKRQGRYYAADYLAVMMHPFVKNINICKDAVVTRIIIHKIEEVLKGSEQGKLSGSLFVDLAHIEKDEQINALAGEMLSSLGMQIEPRDIQEVLSTLHQLFFVAWQTVENWTGLCAALGQVLDTVTHKSFLAAYPLNMKIIEHMLDIQEALSKALFASASFERAHMFDLCEEILKNQVVAFRGSPLKGLQILGFLETRSLSFSHVIIMDVNEESLPANTHVSALIPAEILHSLGIQNIERENEIQRYHFTRLISSAKDVHLVYQENNEKVRSRFVEELIWNTQKQQGTLKGFPIAKVTFCVEPEKGDTGVKKTAAHISFLKGFTFSATSINTYMHCPLQFYYHYVIGLKEREVLGADPDGALIGDFIHVLLERSWQQFVGKKPLIDARFKKWFFTLFEEEFARVFEKRMKQDAFLLKTVLSARLGAFLEKEERRQLQSVCALEALYKSVFTFGDHTFSLTAKVDRIDRLESGDLLILDYKSGAETALPQLKTLASLQNTRKAIKKTIRSVQLPLYIHLVQEHYPQESLNAALYHLRSLDINYLFKTKTSQEENIKQEMIHQCMNAVGWLLEEIVNPEKDFVADKDDPRACSYCPFACLCR